MIKTCLFPGIALLCLLLAATFNVSGHSGGHYHRNDGTVFTVWVLKNGQTIRGNFYKGKGDIMIVEQEEGVLIKVPLNDLSAQSEKLARFKIKRIAALNEQYLEAYGKPLPQRAAINYNYLLLSAMLAIFAGAIIFKGLTRFNNEVFFKPRALTALCSFALLFLSAYACKKSAEKIINPATTLAKTSTGFIDSAFAAYKPALATSWDNNYFYVSSNRHTTQNMMVGITSWQQQVPTPQAYTGNNSWSIPLQPAYATAPLSLKTNFMMGAVAIAVNGVPIFNALNNRVQDSYLIGELDEWGGHCGRADDYHYHIAPLQLAANQSLKPIAFALDGFAVYGSREPDGTAMLPLDTCHGHVGSNGVYHYHGTTTYPYMIGAMRGAVTVDPTTIAPQNQIIPQAASTPMRPATNPLNGAVITAFSAPTTSAYKLTYQISGKNGYISYSWDAANKYTFIFTDTSGNTTTAVYQK